MAPPLSQRHAVVVGAGPAGLMAAERLARGGAAVTVLERMPSAARKFLMAGRGGLNITHSEPFERFVTRYGGALPRLQAALNAFTPDDLRNWCAALGEPTFVGSSGRVFPTSFKASPLLRAWLRRLAEEGVSLRLRHEWRGWSEDGRLRIAAPDGETLVAADAVVLALGGASWPKLGSAGAWVDALAGKSIAINPLRPANSGFHAPWSDVFRERFEGQPLKNVALSHQGEVARGDVIVTRAGLEGGAVYALSASLRDAIAARGETVLTLKLRPDVDNAALAARLGGTRGKQSFSTFLRKASGLSAPAIGLLQEVAIASGITLSALSPADLAALINALPVRLDGVAAIDRAISTAGGIAFDEVGDDFMLRKLPGVFVAGEMLDWEAPTGGYLLQASFATGLAAGEGALSWLRAHG